jgi:ubiquinone/menaquinone biosynthesis C-methylase UbiE
MLEKVLRHARQGTLLQAVRRKLGAQAQQGDEHNHYHGDVAKGYLDKRLQQASWHREQEVVQALLNGLPDGIKVLDVAIGTGRFVPMYLAKNMSVDGIDISADMLAAAREALGPDFDRCRMTLGSADALPYEDQRFDLVVCFRFFGLIPLSMARRVLTQIERVSRGPMIIRVPVRKSDAPATQVREDQPVQGQMREAELADLFSQYGYQIAARHVVEDRPRKEFVVYLLNRAPT